MYVNLHGRKSHGNLPCFVYWKCVLPPQFFWLARLAGLALLATNKQTSFAISPQFKAETLGQSAEEFSLKEIRKGERKKQLIHL